MQCCECRDENLDQLTGNTVESLQKGRQSANFELGQADFTKSNSGRLVARFLLDFAV